MKKVNIEEDLKRAEEEFKVAERIYPEKIRYSKETSSNYLACMMSLNFAIYHQNQVIIKLLKGIYERY